MRDSQKSKVYRAERFAEQVWDADQRRWMPMEEVQKWCKAVSRSFHFRKTIRPVESHRWSAYATDRGYRTGEYIHILGRRMTERVPIISLPKWAQSPLVVCHELAHHAAGLDHGHDGRFVSVYIQLVRRFVGPTEADVLKLAFRESRVKTKKNKGGIR